MRGSAKVWVLAFVAVAGVGLGGLIGIGCAIGANACPFTDRPAFTTTEGSEIFAARCALCHGPAAGGTENAPSLVAGEPGGYTIELLREKIGRGRPLAGMPAFRRELTPAQIEAVARYLIGLRERT